MHHILLVHVRHGGHQLSEDDASLGLGEAVLLFESLQQLPSSHELHDDVHVQLICKDVLQPHNVRVTLTQLEDRHLTSGIVPVRHVSREQGPQKTLERYLLRGT